MWVYGKRQPILEPRPALEALRRRLAGLGAAPAGIERHAALARGFIDLGILAQGLADAEFEARGEDDLTPLQIAAMAALRALAGRLAGSWRGRFRTLTPFDPEPLDALAAQPLPDAVKVRAPEGYAFYAVYPEAYVEAAAGLGGAGAVIGLRSIGTSLAAAAAAGAGARAPISLRPTGHPFHRQLRLSARLEAQILGSGAGTFVVADEGPGLSGSSFCAAADWLQARGVPAERIALLPSHGGAPGPMASEACRRLWAQVRRPVATFDDLALHPADPAHGLERWVADLTGAPLRPLQDLSGGAWRRLQGQDEPGWPPAYPGQERRKFRLLSGRGAFLLKFAGLGAIGEAKLERGLRLADAGFCLRPLGLRHGFLVEPWIEARPLGGRHPREALMSWLARYLAFRARSFPAGPDDGAGEGELKAMIAANVGEALGQAAARALGSSLPSGAPLRPVGVDGRLHAWEWRVTPDGRLFKTDALDHDDAHDLIGRQDLAWDVAGAEIELGLCEAESARLTLRLGPSAPDPAALRLMRAAYPAFQLGLWSQAAEASDPAERARIAPLLAAYASRLKALAQGS